MGYYDVTPPEDLSQILEALPKLTGYDQLQQALDLADYDPLFDTLRAYNYTGRPPYPVDAMYRAILSRYLLSIPDASKLVDRLRIDPRLREICRLGDRVPSESMISRFFKRLSAHVDLIYQSIIDTIDRLARLIDNQRKFDDYSVGSIIAIDSTHVPTFAHPRRDPPTDPDARWGHKTSHRTKDGTNVEYTFGYKVHQVNDAVYGIPLTNILLPANASDSPQLPKLVKKALAEHRWLDPEYAVCDKGYDSTKNYKFLDDRMIAPIILIRDTYKKGDLYDSKGRPICIGNQPMQYVETYPERGHLFRCNPEGCHLKNQLAFSLYCRDTCYENSDESAEILRKVGRIARASREFRDIYRYRQSIERYFGSNKRSRLLDQHRYRSMTKINLHVALATLTYVVTMLAHVLMGNIDGMRQMRIRLPKQPSVDERGSHAAASSSASFFSCLQSLTICWRRCCNAMCI
ncbi:MAG: transposase [Chloroflexi bacterium]|nr:transposase [Chloroflexota bacterium]